MLNQVRIAGRIEGEIDLRRRDDGFETARVDLRFSMAQGPILLFCVGAATRHLAQFRRGDLVTIFGRLTVSRSGKCSILVDEAHYAVPQERELELEFHSATRRFQSRAEIRGLSRWSKRGNWAR